LHGTVAEPDLRGFDPATRLLLVKERNKGVSLFDPHRSADELLAEAARLARVDTPEHAAVMSLQTVSQHSPLIISNLPQAARGPDIRPAAQAGRFYPAHPAALSRLVDQCLDGDSVQPATWPAAMVPHAGLVYSGRIAGNVLRRIKLPSTIIVLGPKHTPHGTEWAVAPHLQWSIPGATINSDPRLARRLSQAIPGLELDAAAHTQEHAIEVELPFLARLAPQSRVVGIALGAASWHRCQQFATGLAQVLRELPEQPLLLISSDMNHFATDAENRRLDEIALQAMETLNPHRLLTTVTRERISMCGIVPATIVLETLRQLGQLTRIERAGYATSADVSGDPSRVVGYAGMLIT
jgi:AmmeMemoRadiSam system protein B